MEKKVKMLLVCLFLSVGMAMAQTKITGTVISEEDGEPIVGATVKIAGTTQGTLTDVNGKFTVTLPQGKKTLQVSYVGMVPQSVAAKNNMRIVLASDSKVLQDVVVTAMGIKRSAKALGYSATAVDGDKIAAARTNDVMSSLAGKVPVSQSQAHRATQVLQTRLSSVVSAHCRETTSHSTLSTECH